MTGAKPFQQPQSATLDYAKLAFVFQQMMRGVATCTLVEVIACTNDGGLTAAGTVDIRPLVNQVDGSGQPMPHDVIYGVPYGRWQGGVNAVIMDPVAGDIGVAVFASRDISAVKNAKAQANPGSRRTFDYADALYIGGMLNDTPTQFVQFNSDGITVHSPTKVTVTAPEIDLTATTKVAVDAPEVDITGGTVVNIQAPTINLKGEVVQTDGDVSMAQNLTVTGDALVGGGLTVDGTTTGHGSAAFTGDVTANGTSVHTHDHGPGTYVAGSTAVTGDSGAPL